MRHLVVHFRTTETFCYRHNPVNELDKKSKKFA